MYLPGIHVLQRPEGNPSSQVYVLSANALQLLWDSVRDIELTSWPNLYRLRDLFEVTISALTIRLERLGVLYVSKDGQLYPSRQEYHGQTRMAL